PITTETGQGIFYLPAQFLLLWDFHFMKKVDQWQSTYGKKMESWLRTLGKIESLASFAYLAYDEPFWCHAQFSKDKRIYRAEKIGHPLIPLQKRVYNHANLEESKPLWMITGSNMSGKTTFLRTLGINLVLALAGGPVMAKSMEISYFDLRTSITIRDSLELGHSYFMAEVYKIKEIVDLAKQASPSAPLFYLLDEMLHGTNSEDRRKAAFSILDFLGKTHSLGAVTTHDLSIATHPILKPLAEQYHFQEEYGEVLKFDYKLKKGYATQSNALKIIEMLGIPIHDNE
ncbi:MAG: DNA mismatch repair protein MutS, partial [Planctomycetota bacterium]